MKDRKPRLVNRQFKPALIALTVTAILVAGALTQVFAASQTKSPSQSVTPNGQLSNPNNAFTSNDVYATGSGNQGYSGFGFTIPSGATINGIAVHLEANSGACTRTTKKYKAKLNNGTSDSVEKETVSNYGSSDQTQTVGGSNDLWNLSWTPDSVNNNLKVVVITQCSGGGAPQSMSLDHVSVTVYYAASDPFPDGATSFTQGFYGSSPAGEAVTNDPDLIDQATCQEIDDILVAIGVATTADFDCTSQLGRTALAFFLTGTVGPQADNGFLPSGFSPGHNLAAQKITTLLNLRLSANAGLQSGQIPIQAGWYINIEPVQDVVVGVPGLTYDPIVTTASSLVLTNYSGDLGTCTGDTDVNDFVCGGAVALSDLGQKVEELDIAGTTVQNILDAADDMINGAGLNVDGTVTLNGVNLTAGDLTKILGLINESFDAGVITGFVAAFDAD